ncbi:unnamed protein product [Penicillium pancosmium]
MPKFTKRKYLDLHQLSKPSEEKVIELANDTEYGLMPGIFTRDINRVLRVSAKIDSGVVGINCVSMALRAFTESKTILINMSA